GPPLSKGKRPDCLGYGIRETGARSNISPEHEKMLICVTCIVVLFQIGLNTLRKVDVGTAISI
ncbi:hypothetical protein, partial [Burkholderia cepacia]|uniref:hypothetical protein n=1 Tax=Burkholderia cepacia TaxID=292 RepID=UPI001C727B2B